MLSGFWLLSNILNECIADQECVIPWPGWTLKHKAASWKDLYFPEVHNLPGS